MNERTDDRTDVSVEEETDRQMFAWKNNWRQTSPALFPLPFLVDDLKMKAKEKKKRI